MAGFGGCLLYGLGGPKNTSLGWVYITDAAHLGSNLGAYRLGWAFFNGFWGLPKDPARARSWLKKVVDGECEHKHLNSRWIASPAEMLRELDEQASELEE